MTKLFPLVCYVWLFVVAVVIVMSAVQYSSRVVKALAGRSSPSSGQFWLDVASAIVSDLLLAFVVLVIVGHL